MKKLILICIITIFSGKLLSQDTSITRFLPLSVGNTWIYSCSASGNFCLCSKKIKITVTGTVLKYGKTYYVFERRELDIFCVSPSCYMPIPAFDTMRVDPVSGNLYKFSQNGGCAYTPFEIIQDSLRANLNDTIRVSCLQPGISCTDTTSQNIFGQNYISKKFALIYVDSGWDRKYAKGLGIIGGGSFGQSCTSNFNLLGCVIDGVIFGDTAFSQVNNDYLSYLPLGVGNTWVYSFQYIYFGGGGVGFDKYKITNTVQINGKTYYAFQHSHIQHSGTYNCFPVLFSEDKPIRVDTLSGNIYRADSCGLFYESLVDSLRSKIGDSSKFCGDTVSCHDTNYFNIFGQNRSSINFQQGWFESANNQRFVKNIGAAYFVYGFMSGSCTSNLKGCVINGQVYGDTSFADLNTITGTVRYRDNNMNVSSGYVKAYRHSYLGLLDVVDSAAIQTDGTYRLIHIPRDTIDLMAFQNDEDALEFVPTYYLSTINWQDAGHLYLNSDTSGIDIRVFRITNDGLSSGKISGYIYGYTASWLGISDARLYAWNSNTYRMYSISGQTGAYSIDSLPSGFYQIICNRINYPTQTRNVYLGRNNRTDINFYFDHLVGIKKENEIPEKYSLSQNYPNPFNPATNIRFDIAGKQFVVLKIFDILGKEILTLVNEELNPGKYNIDWNAANFPSGVYFYRIQAGDFKDSKKMVLIK
jgi:type IX secretion system substrate protein